MDTKKLRQKILDLAIRGKLVPQDPNDEPASVLLERIRTEKERLIKEGKIKRSKKSISDEEIDAPFEIPENWEWCKFGEYLDVRDGTHDSPKYVEKGIPFVTSKNLKDGKIDFSNVNYISEENHKEFIKRSKVDNGDILFAMIGSIGNSTLVNTNVEFSIKNVALFKPLASDTNMRFVLLFLKYVEAQLQRDAKGGMQPFVPLNYFRNDLYMSVPPFAEQERIVNEVERWFAVIDALESNEGDLLKAIDQAKFKILDLAIHGKLVPQDPNDEPAIELLKRINPKFEPCDNELYGNVALNWTLAKVDDIGELLSGRDLSNDVCNNESKGIPYLIGASNILDNTFSFVRWTEQPQVISILGDMLISCKGTIGTIIKNNIGNMHIARQFMAIRPNGGCISSDYLYICLMAIIGEIKKNARGVIPGISREDILGETVPLPPYQEQLRIVAKIEELFAVLDSIKESLE